MLKNKMSRQMREITIDEINYVLDIFKNEAYADIDVYNALYQNIRNHIIETLRGKMIYPTKKYLDELRDKLYEQFVTARIHNETFVGIISAHSLSKSTTQLILHSKRGQGGNKSYLNSFDIIKGNVKFNKNPKISLVYTFTKIRHKFDDIRRIFTPLFTNVNFSEIVYEYMIINKDDIKENDQDFDMSWYEDMEAPEVPYDNIFIRLFLKKDVIYEMKISSSTIENSLKDISNGLFIPVVSPMSIGIIDIYPVPSQLRKINEFKKRTLSEDFLAMMFLSGTFVPRFDTIHISGIEGVKYVEPKKIRISSFINSELLIDETKNHWEVSWDQITARNSGVFFEDIEYLFEPFGVKPKAYPHIPNKFFFRHWPFSVSPLSIVKLSQFSEYFRESERNDKGWRVTYEFPVDNTMNETQRYDLIFDVMSIIYPESDFKINLSKNFVNVELKGEDVDKDKDPLVIIQDLVNVIAEHDELVYMEITSTNLISILAHDQVDMRKTYTNNSHLALDSFGIEGYRNMFIITTSDLLLASGKEFNSRHIELLVDHLVMNGFVTPISIIGVEGQRLGPFVESSFQEADKILNKAAEFGRTDHLNTPSAYLTIGKKGNYGIDYARSIGKPIVGSKRDLEIFEKYQAENETERYFALMDQDIPEIDKVINVMTENIRNKELFRSIFMTTRNTVTRPVIKDFVDIRSQFPSVIVMKTPTFSHYTRRNTMSIIRFLSEFHNKRGNDIHICFAEDEYPPITSLFPLLKHMIFIFSDTITEKQISYDKKIDRVVEWKGNETEFDEDDFMDNDFNYIFIVREKVTDNNMEIPEIMRDLFDHKDILFSSCLRIASNNDEEILRKMGVQYNWTEILLPRQANLTYVVPRFNNKKAIVDIEDLPTNPRFSWKNDYLEGGFQYFTGNIVIVPWGQFGNLSSFLHTDAVFYDYQFKDYQKRMTYYNNFERPYVFHENKHADSRIGFDHCNDCTLESWIWEQYIKYSKSKKTVKQYVKDLQPKVTSFKMHGHGYFFSPPYPLELIKDLYQKPDEDVESFIMEQRESDMVPGNRTVNL